jgi:regulator of extracellular matrix RemA (YlzA/DUF370 family)
MGMHPKGISCWAPVVFANSAASRSRHISSLKIAQLRYLKFTRIGVIKMDQNLLNIGFGNTVVAERVVAIVSPNSAPMKRLKDEARDEKRLVDVTHGRKTRSIIIMDSNHIVLSAIQAETISQRYTTLKGAV